jgi:hypothetical protein
MQVDNCSIVASYQEILAESIHLLSPWLLIRNMTSKALGSAGLL